MAEITIIGAGAGGMLTALLLAEDAHDITVLERDSDPPPSTTSLAWTEWERPGVNQFRQPHGFEGRLRQVMHDELPDLWEDFRASGAVPVDIKSRSPEPDSWAPGDEWLYWEGLLRPTYDCLLDKSAARRGNIEVRRGLGVRDVVAGPEHRAGIPHVAGVICDDGSVVNADLVVDGSGRRTSLQRLVSDLGASVTTQAESDGFTYFTRWFRRTKGKLPEHPGLGGLMPGLIFLIFPGEDGCFAIAVVGSIKDRPIRKLRDPDRFMSVTLSTSQAAEWVDPAVAEPITDIMPMGSIQNRQLRFWSNGKPSVTGLVNVADSATSTNPSLGRGIPLAAGYALALRQVLRENDDPYDIVSSYDDTTDRTLTPWLNDSIESDASLRAAFAVMIDPENSPPRELTDRRAIQTAAQADMECWRAWYRVDQGFDMPSVVLDDAELIAKARAIAEEIPPPAPDISRGELVDLLT